MAQIRESNDLTLAQPRFFSFESYPLSSAALKIYAAKLILAADKKIKVISFTAVKTSVRVEVLTEKL